MSLRDAAHWYADRGWPVFPLAPRAKVPFIPRRHGGRGCLDAVTDHNQIAAWWKQCPHANIGVACGGGFFVLDIDPRNSGDDELAWLELGNGALPHTVEACTGGGGRHLFFAGNVGCTKLADGVDVKGSGGYVVAAPSIHPSGRRYLWEASSWPNDTPLAAAPAWLLDAIGSPKHTRGYFEHREPVDVRSFALGVAFEKAGWLGSQIRPGVWSVLCPNRGEHSSGHDYDTSTVIFAPAAGRRRGAFHCSHEHCRGRFR